MAYSSTILCVDDDADDLQFIEEAIKSQPHLFHIVEAKDGEAALRYLQDAKSKAALPCLIIMDVNMPRMDGRKAVQLIKEDEALKRIPVIVFTTSSSHTDRSYFEDFKVHYITKPNHYPTFVNKVVEMLSHCSSY